MNSNDGGLGFCGALFLVFLVLKLTNVIAWSWWWVTAPLWGSALLVILLVFILALFFGPFSSDKKSENEQSH